MWICLKNSFLALCRETPDAQNLTVRGRRERDILAVFPDAEVLHTPSNDYQFRANIPEQVVAGAMAREVLEVDYRKFKPQCKDRALHDSYMSAWHSMLGIQEPGTGGIYNHQ